MELESQGGGQSFFFFLVVWGGGGVIESVKAVEKEFPLCDHTVLCASAWHRTFKAWVLWF